MSLFAIRRRAPFSLPQRAAAFLLLALAALASHAAETQRAGLEIADGYVREMPPGHPVSGAFFTLRNHGEAPLHIVGGHCDCADGVELHRHQQSGGMMRMEAVPEVVIAPGQTFEFQPGGYHVMLIGLTRPLQAGDQVTLTLLDADGGKHRQHLPVVRATGSGHGHH